MWFSHNNQLLTLIAQETVAKNLRDAEIDSWASRLGTKGTSRWTHPFGRVLYNVGHWIVILGQRLDRIEPHTV